MQELPPAHRLQSHIGNRESEVGGGRCRQYKVKASVSGAPIAPPVT